MMDRRRFLKGAALAPLATSIPAMAADDYPNRPIKIIVPAATGLAVDASARYFANKLSERFKIGVAVENISGVGGVLGYNAAAQAKPDGYTLIIAGIPIYLLPLFHESAKFDPIKSYTPLARVSYVPLSIAVSAESPVQSMKDLVEYMRRNEGKVRYGSQGIGSVTHVCPTALNMETGTKAENILYKSSQTGVTDVVANRIDFMCLSPTVWIPLRDAGKVRVLAVTGPQRQKQFADVPTMTEAGFPGANVTSMFDFMAPAGTPDAIVSKLATAFVETAQTDEFRQMSEKLMFIPGTMGRDELARAMPKEYDYWKKVAATIPKQ